MSWQACGWSDTTSFIARSCTRSAEDRVGRNDPGSGVLG
jgi:hypothetical protein